MWIPRLLRAGAGVGLVVLGWVLAVSLPGVRALPWLAALVAAGTVAIGFSLLDSWRTDRLLRWLRAPRSPVAPHEEGPWGDLTYRIERIVELNRRELKREQARLADFLEAIEASPNGVLLLDANEQIAWLNTQAAAHFDLNPQRDLQQRITNLVRKPEFVQHLQQRVVDHALLFTLHNGRSISVMLRLYGEGAMLLLSQDVSERERTEAMRRDFVANVSHEIRTPLAALSGFVESLGTLNLQGSERSRVLELMRQQSVRMQALVDDLLTLARLEGSPRPSPDSWFSLDTLIGLVMAESQGLSAGRHQFDWPQQSAHLELAGVESEMHSAITNLVSNAVRYTPAHGRIALAVTLQADGGVALRVTDSGPGIAAEHLPRLTERFYRVDGSRSRVTGGTGLGLSIVKHVCQRHGGELRIESEIGVGSSFTLVWPAVRVRSSDDAQGVLGEESAPSRLALVGRER
jgi:two-component system, OmpR family, phosphate regulon sensor histidine kinase PhoR